MIEEDRLQAALLDWEGEGGSVAGPEHSRDSPPPSLGAAVRLEPPAIDRTPSARHRRGSLGPDPVATPLGEAASGAALHAHLVHLLDARRDRAPRPENPATITGEMTPHEDLERQPDGAPHLVIGLTALSSVAFAAVLIGMLHTGPTLGSIAAVVLAIIAIPVLVVRLGAKAERDRDHIHPSR
jgi:hypothetical protein